MLEISSCSPNPDNSMDIHNKVMKTMSSQFNIINERRPKAKIISNSDGVSEKILTL